MTSMTSPQHTDRGKTDEIPGPRGGQGVRLLVLGADPDAQQLRDRAQAAGYELAQRYSPRVSHVAYGSGIDPEDARYARIRDAGLPLVPLQACASELGLPGDAERDLEDRPAAEAPIEVEPDPETEPELELELEAEPEYEAAPDRTLEAPDFPPLAAVVIGVDPWEGEQQAPATEPEAEFSEPEPEPPLPRETEREIEPEPQPDTASETDSATEPEPAPVDQAGSADPAAARSGVGRFLSSILWALIPFLTFGLLSPITFGYAAYRLRSRGLAVTTLAYTLAVMLAFVLSAARPHASAPSDAAGALLTVCLAGTWVGGTLHALSLRTRVFAR
jgi:hypothetical protein